MRSSVNVNMSDVIARAERLDRKSTRLNSGHSQISYAVFCLKKKKPRHTSLHQPPLPQRLSQTHQIACCQRHMIDLESADQLTHKHRLDHPVKHTVHTARPLA